MECMVTGCASKFGNGDGDGERLGLLGTTRVGLGSKNRVASKVGSMLAVGSGLGRRLGIDSRHTALM